MEDFKEREIVFSKAIKAGKRIYYLDVKKSRNEELFLSVTESKKKLDDNGPISFEKHKIFLYKEDFDKFLDGMHEVIDYIKENQVEPVRPAAPKEGGEDILNDIDKEFSNL